MRFSSRAIASTLTLLCLTGASFAPSYAMSAKQTVEVETIIQNPDGTETVTRTPAERVLPGNRVVYSIIYTNDTTDAASDLEFTMPVPEELRLIEGTADKPGTIVSVSTDGGTEFTSREAARVFENGQTIPAGAEHITHVRWTIAGPVAPGVTDSVEYKALLE